MGNYFIYFFAIMLAATEMTGLVFMGAIITICAKMWVLNPSYPQIQIVERNLHIFLTSLGSVFIHANGGLIFRVLRNFRTSALKHFHIFVHALGVLLAIWGIWCGIKSIIYMRPSEGNHFSSLHSTLGLLSGILIIVQFVLGIIVYTCKKLVNNEKLIDDFNGIHGFVGMASLYLNAITAIVGIGKVANEPRYFDVLIADDNITEANYENFTMEFQVCFAAAIFLAFFTWNVFYVTINPYFEWTMIERF